MPAGGWLAGDGLAGGDYDIDERLELLPPYENAAAVEEPDSEVLVDSVESEATHP
jgi:hypothetical protein